MSLQQSKAISDTGIFRRISSPFNNNMLNSLTSVEKVANLNS